MSICTDNSKPLYDVGDRVEVTFPGIHCGRHGIVTGVLPHQGSHTYTYRVHFTTGEIRMFFERELIQA